MDAVRRYGLFGAAAVFAAVYLGLASSIYAPYAIVAGLLAVLAACAGVIVVSTRFGALVTALFALACNLYLLDQKLNEGSYTACAIGNVFDCGSINESAWSTAFDVPITLLGSAFYASLALAALLTPRGAKDDGTFDQVNALFGIVTVVYSAFLGYIAFTLGSVCVFCIAIYIASGLLLWAGLKGLKEHQRSLTQDLFGLVNSNPLQTVAGGFVVLAVLGVRSMPTDSGATDLPTAGATAQDYNKLYGRVSGQVPIDGSAPVLGDPSAPYVVVEYADFGCGHCAAAAKQFKDLVSIRRDIQVRFRYFPLSGVCNPALPDLGTGQERCLAAFAAECAHKQGKFWDMSSILFQNQPAFAPDQIQLMAQDIGLEMGSFEQCLTNPAIEATVAEAGRSGGDLGLKGTPAIYLKGLFGDQFVEVKGGVEAVLVLIEAKDDGVALTPPT